jgi:transcriptional regulator with XRE-family HTH domain
MEDRETSSPAVQRRRLRAELRRARLDAGLTQEQVASAMDWSLSKLIRIENGTVGISTNDLKAVLTHYKIADESRVAEFLAMSRASRERSWWSSYRDAASPRLLQLIEYEAASSIIRLFQPLLIPGLLQTEEYARTMISMFTGQASASQVNTFTEIRMKRQQLLRRSGAPLMFFIMDEAAVRRHIGGKEAMQRQIQRLLDVSDMANVTIEIIPFSAGAYPVLQGPFQLFEFPDAADDDALYLESPRGDLLTRDDKEEIVYFRERFELLRQASLGPDGSVSFLRQVMAELG